MFVNIFNVIVHKRWSSFIGSTCNRIHLSVLEEDSVKSCKVCQLTK